MDTIRHTEEEQAEMLGWHTESVVKCGLAGTIFFTWTDEWFTGGEEISDWAFGIVTRAREPKSSARQSPAGEALLNVGVRVVGTPLGIVAAMLFVSVPLYISAAREAFVRVDPRFESVARTLGDTQWRVFGRITLPLALRGLVAAAVVMWARAVSEFGSIVILTYNPKVASVLSYDRFTSFGLPEALPVAAVLAILALIPLTLLRMLRYERGTET
jgi:ABC-type sulfate transport system permease component